MAKFKSTLMTRLATAIEDDLQNDPDCVKGRKKTVQVSRVVVAKKQKNPFPDLQSLL